MASSNRNDQFSVGLMGSRMKFLVLGIRLRVESLKRGEFHSTDYMPASVLGPGDWALNSQG